MGRQSIHGELLLDRYRISDRFSGGMGVLWTVTDAQTGHPYAIKTVREERFADRFRQEAETWIALGHHDNVVQALWLIEDASGPYLVLEYIDGSNLEQVLEAGPLPVERALDLAMQCARGMAFAHTVPLAGGLGLVHRDIKPANLLLAENGLLKISDFGLARLSREQAEEGVGVGTPAYTAPEQLRGERGADGRADIYSFGLVLYEMLTGANPLRCDDKNNVSEQLRRVLEFVPPVLESVPPPLAALVARCIEKDPARRPYSFGEVAAHLASIARDIEYDYRVDPAQVPPPEQPTGVVVDVPVFRPRRPRAGIPFAIELGAHGDFGPGPVSLCWRLPATDGLNLLTPAGGECMRLEAGGAAHARLRIHAVAREDGSFALPATVLEVNGPEGDVSYDVAAFHIDVDFAFVPPLHGRAAEMARLEEIARTGGSLFVFGDVGGGKSRLLIEAARLGVAVGRRVVAGRGQQAGMRPMRILNDVARGLLGLPRDSLGSVRAQVNALLGDDPATADYFARVLAGDSPFARETPLMYRWFELVAAAASREPLLLLLDDLHFADETAVKIIVELAARARDEGLDVGLVATCTARPEGTVERHRAQLAQGIVVRRKLARADLKRLTRDETAQLLGEVFEGHGFAEEAPWLLDTIVSVTEGNPSHVAEILYVLRRDAATFADGEWRLLPNLGPERLRGMIPKGLDGAVRDRLRGVPSKARDALEVAALIGEEFDVTLLKGALGNDADVDGQLHELERAEIVRPVGADLDRYRFWTAAAARLVRRALRGTPRRKQWHRRLARAMLKAYTGERLVRNSLSIAQHLRGAGMEAASLPYTLAGCQRLLSLQLSGRARRLLANARQLAEADAERVNRFHYLYGIACEATGEYDEGFDALTRFVEARVSLPGSPRSVARAYARLARIHRARGEFESAQFCLGVARELLEELGDYRALAFVLESLAGLYIDRGQAHEAQRLLEQARDVAAESGNEGAGIRVAVLAGRLALDLDRPVDARREFLDALARARALGDRERTAASLKGLALVSLRLGYLDRAREQLGAAIDLYIRMGDRAGVATLLVHLGTALQTGGRTADALRHLRRGRRLFDELGHPEGVAAARHRIGIVLRDAGRTTEAVGELAAAAEGFARLDLPDRVTALHDLGCSLADAGTDRAARLALARADRAGSRLQRVLGRTVRIRMALRAGDVARARVLARAALRQAARTSGHSGRIAANLGAADAALAAGDLQEARRASDTVAAFAREQGDLLAVAEAERVLLTLAGRAGRNDEVMERAHRAARAFTGRSDARDGPARLVVALSAFMPRYSRAAHRCCARLEAGGFKPPVIAE